MTESSGTEIRDAFGQVYDWQIHAIIERAVSNALQAVWEVYDWQIRAILERAVSNGLQAVWERDVRKTGVAPESGRAPARTPIGNDVSNRPFGCRVLDQRSAAVVEKHPINTLIERVRRVNGNFLEIVRRERAVSNCGYIPWDHDA